MKRVTAAALALCLLLAGCSAGAPAAAGAGERANIEGIRDRVASTAQMITKVDAIIDWQITTSEKDIAQVEAARQNGELYTPPDYADEVRQKQAELEDCLSAVSAGSDWAAALRPCGLESIDLTYEAAARYFSEVESALEDLADIMAFYFTYLEAAEPLASFDAEAYATDKERIYDLYYAVDDVRTKLSRLDCPEFMAQTFRLYISRLEHFMAILDEQYIGVQLNDPLRLSSGIYMLARVELEHYEYGVMLTRDFNLQYGKVGERLGGWVGELGRELADNCAALLRAM